MMSEEASKKLTFTRNEYYCDQLIEAADEFWDSLDDEIKAWVWEEEEPCEDCISRQAVNNLLYAELTKFKTDGFHLPISKTWQIVIDKIDSLPSVTPTHKKGEWCKQNDDYFDWYECSECGYGSEGEMQYSSDYDVRTNFCPNCGADMRGEEE